MIKNYLGSECDHVPDSRFPSRMLAKNQRLTPPLLLLIKPWRPLRPPRTPTTRHASLHGCVSDQEFVPHTPGTVLDSGAQVRRLALGHVRLLLVTVRLGHI